MSEQTFRRVDAPTALSILFAACDQERPYTLFDARDAHAFGHGHIPTAQPIAERDLGRLVRSMPRAQTVLIYCNQGFSSQTFAKAFADFGFEAVYSVDGGFPALVEALRGMREASAASAQDGAAQGNGGADALASN